MSAAPQQLPIRVRGERLRLPDERDGVTRTLRVYAAGDDGEPREVSCYVTVGLYPDGAPGELFIHVDREGSTLSGFADALAMVISVGLQYGVPLAAYTAKLRRTRFEPSGRTGDAEQPAAASLLDYIAGWLERRFPAAAAGMR